jgi:GxxExxY protein
MLLEKVECDELAGLGEQVLDTARRVYRRLGPEHTRHDYIEALCQELEQREITCKRELWQPEMLHGAPLNVGYVLDVIAADRVVVSVLAQPAIERVNEEQLLAMLTLSGHNLGYVVNFAARDFDSAVRQLFYGQPALQETPVS